MHSYDVKVARKMRDRFYIDSLVWNISEADVASTYLIQCAAYTQRHEPNLTVTAKEGEAVAALPAGTRQQLGAALLDASNCTSGYCAWPRATPTNMTHAEAFAGDLRVRAWRRLLEATGYRRPHALKDPIDLDDLEPRLNQHEARW